MERRRFIAGALSLLAAPLAAEAQATGKGARIGVLWPGPSPPRPPRMEAFRQGLSESGYVEGQNLSVELRYAERGVARLPQLAVELVRLNVQVIATIGIQATSVTRRATATIPIVALTDELVRPGLVASLARPGGNITGVQILAPEISAKRLELLKQLVPVVSRVAVLSDPGQSVSQLPPLEDAARSLGVQLQVLEVRGEAEIETTFQSAQSSRAGAVLVLASPLLFGYSRTITGLAAKYRLPAVYEWREAVEAGGLASYGPVLAEMWRQTALLVGKVLKGAHPADLPVVQPTKFELAINLKAAKALGLTIPPSVLAQADEVIQ